LRNRGSRFAKQIRMEMLKDGCQAVKQSAQILIIEEMQDVPRTAQIFARVSICQNYEVQDIPRMAEIFATITKCKTVPRTVKIFARVSICQNYEVQDVPRMAEIFVSMT
jgi:hypothetical protein